MAGSVEFRADVLGIGRRTHCVLIECDLEEVVIRVLKSHVAAGPGVWDECVVPECPVRPYPQELPKVDQGLAGLKCRYHAAIDELKRRGMDP